MLTQSNFLENKKLSESPINKRKSHEVNRGIELMLSGGKKKQPKLFHIFFEKMIYFLNKEVDIYFEFSFHIRNKKNNSSL